MGYGKRAIELLSRYFQGELADLREDETAATPVYNSLGTAEEVRGRGASGRGRGGRRWWRGGKREG